MAIARLTGQDALGASTTTSVSATYGSTPTTGNTMIATVYANVGIGLESISGWTNVVSGAFSGTAQSVTIWAKVAGVGESTTVSCTGAIGATIMRIHIYEYSGLAATLTTDGTNTATSGVTSVTSLLSGSIATTNANDLLFIAGATGGSSTAQSYNSSFSLRQTDASAIRLFDADQIVSATGTYSSTGSWTSSLRAGSAIAAFQGAGGTSASITQIHATLTATGGTQSVATVQDASVSQTAATITATGGTQAIATVNDVNVTQSSANLTAVGGTQSVSTVDIVSVVQTGASVTATGGSQSAQAIQDVSITQSAAILTVQAGTQAISPIQDVSIGQSAANITASGGTQAVSSIDIGSVSSLAANVIATGGTQSVSVQVGIEITQQVASIIASGGTQSVTGNSGTVDIDVTQSAATITVTGGTQVISTSTGPIKTTTSARFIFLTDGHVAMRLSGTLYVPL